MNEKLYQYITGLSGTLTTEEILTSFVAALIIGAVIYVSYRFSHTASVYSAKFNVSLLMLTLVTTMIMSVIGNNLALSLGMVGALSIVRFRTAIKDSRDTTYIFWCIAAGICCGISDFLVAGIGTGVIFIVMLILGNVRNNDRFLLVVKGKEGTRDISRVVDNYYGHKARLCVDNSDRQSVELIYELSERVVRKARRKQGEDVKTVLFEISSVESVNLIAQNDEIVR